MKTQIKTVPGRVLFSSLAFVFFFIKKAYSIYLDNICANSEGAPNSNFYDYFGQWKFMQF